VIIGEQIAVFHLIERARDAADPQFHVAAHFLRRVAARDDVGHREAAARFENSKGLPPSSSRSSRSGHSTTHRSIVGHTTSDMTLFLAHGVPELFCHGKPPIDFFLVRGKKKTR